MFANTSITTQNHPIGFFDSGVGGITIWSEIIKLLPFENTLYLADNKNAPYGTKSKDEIIYFSEKNTEYLLENHAKLIVVACNTATTNAITHLRQSFPREYFIGLEPAIKPAVNYSKTRTIGILATDRTLESHHFKQVIHQYPNVKIIQQAGKGLVSLIESNKMDSEEIRLLLDKYLQPMISQNIDALILGCTHYPLLITSIKQILPENIKIIHSGEAVARQTKNILEKNNILNRRKEIPKHHFLANGSIQVMTELLSEFDAIIELKDF